MRSTTTLIASLAVIVAACGPMTVQYVPVDPTTPVVDDEDDTAEGEGGEDDGHDGWEEEKPDIPTDQHDAWEPDKPGIPTGEDDGDATVPPPGGPNIHPPAPPRDSVATPEPDRPERRPPHIQPERPDTPRPPHIQPERPGQPEPPTQPDNPGEPGDPDAPDSRDDVDLGTPRDIRIPPGHMPRDTSCRLWLEGTPPGRQAAPVPCAELHGELPEGAFVLYGDRVWDTEYDWLEHERRTPGSVPAAILELMRARSL